MTHACCKPPSVRAERERETEEGERGEEREREREWERERKAEREREREGERERERRERLERGEAGDDATTICPTNLAPLTLSPIVALHAQPGPVSQTLC